MGATVFFLVVEAGGVEPPSEKARREENYVRIRLRVFASALQNRPERRHASPIGFQPPAPDRSHWPIPQDDAHSPPRGLSGWSGSLIT